MLLQVYKFLSVVDKSFTCYNFTNPLEIHLGKCTRAFIYPRSTRPLMVYIFLLSLPVRLFSGLVGEADSPPILFSPALLHGFHLTSGFVYFQGEFPTPLNLDKNLRVLLFGLLCLFFGGGSEVVSKIYLRPTSARAADVFPSDRSFLRSHLLLSVYQPCLNWTVS